MFVNIRNPVLLAVVGTLAAGVSLYAQVAPTNAPRPILPPGAVFQTPRVLTHPVPPVPQTNQDPLNTLMTTTASIDIESPVTAQAEFDPSVITTGQRAIYRLVFSAMNESITLPDKLPVPEGLQVVQGGRGQNYQPVGGRIQPRTSINFSVTPRTNGNFVMPSFTVTVYGKPVTVPEARLSVVPAANAPVVREPPRMNMELPPGPIYVGQTVRVRVLLPDRGDGTLLGLSQVRISGEGLMNEPYVFSQRREVVQQNGKPTLAFIQEVTMTPIAGGKQTLVAQGYAILSRVNPGQVGILQTSQVLVDSDPVTVDIKSLPAEGKLPGFTGGIGTFTLDNPKLSTNQVMAGEVVSLRVSIRGEGNLGRLVPPDPPFTRDWQIFPPVADPTPAYAVTQRGSNVFTYTLIPLHHRIKATPPIPFSFFDPRKNSYVDITIPPLPLTVQPHPSGSGSGQAAASDSAPGTPEEPREPELAMTGLAERPGAAVSSLAPVQTRPWFLILQLFPAAALIGLLGWDRRRRFLADHPDLVRRRRARRQLRTHLRRFRDAAANGDTAEYISGAVSSLRAVCAPAVDAQPDALVCADILRELPPDERHGNGSVVVRKIFAAADALRFGGAHTNGELLATRAELERLIERLKARL